MLNNIKSRRDHIKIRQAELLFLLDNIKSRRDHIKIKQAKLLALPDSIKIQASKGSSLPGTLEIQPEDLRSGVAALDVPP